MTIDEYKKFPLKMLNKILNQGHVINNNIIIKISHVKY